MAIRKHTSKAGKTSYYVYISERGKPVYVGKRSRKRDAQALESAEKARREKLSPAALDAPRTVDELWERLSPSLSARSQITYGETWKRIRPHLGRKRVDAVTGATIDAMKTALAGEGYAPATIALAVRLVSVLWNKAIEVKWLSGDNPARAKTRDLVKAPAAGDELDEQASPEDVRFIESTSDMAAVLRAAPDGWIRDLIAFGFFTGARLGEVCSVTWQDINWARSQITLRRSIKGPVKESKKRKGPKRLPIQRQLRPVLERRWLAAGKPKKGRVFPEAWTVKDVAAKVRNAIYQARDDAGLDPLTTHEMFRHTFASQFLAAGGDIFKLARYLGHADVALTYQTYSHLIPGAMADDEDRIQLPDWTGKDAEIIPLKK
jgi:integrase